MNKLVESLPVRNFEAALRIQEANIMLRHKRKIYFQEGEVGIYHVAMETVPRAIVRRHRAWVKSRNHVRNLISYGV